VGSLGEPRKGRGLEGKKINEGDSEKRSGKKER